MKEFNCVLESIPPSKIIDKSNINDIDNLFLSLGLIFNDLKGIILFNDILKKEYIKPKDNEISAHGGEYAGIQLQILKLSVALVDEFFLELEKNKEIIKSLRFQLIKNGLNKELKNKWNNIMNIVLNPGKDPNNYLSKIARIRNNIAYHYDHSGTQLRNSFIKRFFDKPKDKSNEKAYYSMGGTIETTRYFYCDAVIHEYINEHLKIESFDYIDKTNKITRDMSMLIVNLMKNYYKYKLNKK